MIKIDFLKNYEISEIYLVYTLYFSYDSDLLLFAFTLTFKLYAMLNKTVISITILINE